MLHKIRLTSSKIHRRLQEIEPLAYHQRRPLPPFRFKAVGSSTDYLSFAVDADDSNWEEILPKTYWAKPRTNFILKTTFQVPPSWTSSDPKAVFLPIGVAGDFSHPEALVYVDGKPYAACDRHHQEILIPDKWCDGKPHTLDLFGWTGLGGSTVGDPDKKLRMGVCETVLIHQPTRDFIALSHVALGIADQLSDAQPARHHLYTALDEAFKALDIREPIQEGFYASILNAHKILRQGISLAGASLDVDITAVGHAHLDVAWLWTLGQTRQKAARTFHNVLRLMEQFPEFRFIQSQPQLYDYIRQDFPVLFKAIQQEVKQGKWEPIGGMWVEADCNLSGPESLARQFLLGRAFFREHFGEGTESPVLWLPDVFGYAWNLPQLIKESGLAYFFTIKIGWSQYNRLPYDSFWWQGLDGTRVLTHFSTTKNPDSPHAATYNADASPGQTLGTWLNFQQKDYGAAGVIPPLLMSYGWGDGGGGPTREMLENIRQMGDFPATPRLHTGKVIDFFHKMDAEVGDRLPTWNGELYLEYHRGTYTTQARVKRANRKSEFLLHDTEFLAAYATLLDSNYPYPRDQINHAWQLVCLNQFHDIIPGSSIGPVYEESLQQYEQVKSSLNSTQDEALEVIRDHLGGDLLVINPSSFPRFDLVSLESELPEGISPTRNGSPIPIQTTDTGTLLDAGELPPYSITPLSFDHPSPSQGSSEDAHNSLSISSTHLENSFLRVELNSAGDIIRIYDKTAGREVLPPGALANQFQAFEDRPLNWDAWDIDIFYDDKMWLAEVASSIRVKENGPLRVALEIRRRILNSDYIQQISLSHNSQRLDFHTTIQWKERRVLLKVSFPADILAPMATYEIQWGNVQRPTHRNTSWDWARFETAAQKWVDLSEGGYGVSLLNDCKYGHDIRDNTMRMTLLRGTTAPDPDADLGTHTFTYSLLPHSGDWKNGTIPAAYAINNPLIATHGNAKNKSAERRPFISSEEANIVIETIKQAEDGYGFIVRLYECHRARGYLTLNTAYPIDKAWLTNILEENQESLDVSGNQIRIAIKPYQIKTLRLVFGNQGYSP